MSLPNPAELIEQLRSETHFRFGDFEGGFAAPTEKELKAADAIEELLQENARLKAELHAAELQHRTERCDAADYDCEELGKLRREIDRLRHGKERLMDNLKAVLEEREDNS